eukprot:4407410-Amphidinium_carterae.1
MLKVASLAALTAYERFMEKLTRLWPTAWHLVYSADDKFTRLWPTAWHLVYSADDKCRAEHLERLRRSVVIDEACGKPRHQLLNLEFVLEYHPTERALPNEE